MRKLNNVSQLNRSAAHRDAMIANLTVSLIQYEKIETTSAKAKVLISYFEKVISEAKKDTISARRRVFSMLNQNNLATDKVFEVLLDVFKDKKSGFTTKVFTGRRSGDNARKTLVRIIREEMVPKTKVGKSENKLAKGEQAKKDKSNTKKKETKKDKPNTKK